MKRPCEYVRWLAALMFVALVSSQATNARAEACFTVSTTPVFVMYNPLSATDSLTQFTVTATNNCPSDTQIRFGFAKGMVELSGASSVLPGYPLGFVSTVHRNSRPEVVIDLNTSASGRTGTTLTLANGQSASRTHTLTIAARQSIAPGSDIPFIVYAASPDEVINLEQVGTLNVVSGFMMTVAGAGSSGLLDFGVLDVDEPVQSVNIHAQATGAYRVTLASEQSGVLRNTAAGAGSYTLPYAVTLGGALISETTPYQASTTSGTILLDQGTAILPLIIDPDTSGVAGLRAGIYRDILTLTISAEP